MRVEDRTNVSLSACADAQTRLPARRSRRAAPYPTNAAITELDEAFSALYEMRSRPAGALSISIIFDGLTAQP